MVEPQTRRQRRGRRLPLGLNCDTDSIMITAAHLQELFHQKPFEPFRIFMSDGSHHDVPHPEFAWVFGSRVFVGVAAGPSAKTGGQVKQLSLLHISRIEPFAPSKAKKKPSTSVG